MHLLHAMPGAAGRLRLSSEADRIDRCDDLDDLDLWVRYADYDAVLLDPSAERGVGRRWAQRYRARGGRAGLVFVVEAIDAESAVASYETCDDLVRLPIEPDEMLARLGALVRRCRGYASAPLAIGPLVLDPATGRARYGDRDVGLTPREVGVLEFVMLRAGKAVSRDAILTRIYQERDEAQARIVDVWICRIRQKLTDAGAPEDVISTEWGTGFSIARPAGDTGVATHALRSVA